MDVWGGGSFDSGISDLRINLAPSGTQRGLLTTSIHHVPHSHTRAPTNTLNQFEQAYYQSPLHRHLKNPHINQNTHTPPMPQTHQACASVPQTHLKAFKLFIGRSLNKK